MVKRYFVDKYAKKVYITIKQMLNCYIEIKQNINAMRKDGFYYEEDL